MLKTFLALAALTATAAAEPANFRATRFYDVRATAVDWIDLPSCGAAKRMLHDHHHILLLDDKVYVNGLEWHRLSSGLVSTIEFHDYGLVYLTMDIAVDDRALIGQYTLYGVTNRTKDGFERCADRVELRGER